MTRLVHVITDLGFGGAQAILAQLVAATCDRFEHHVISLRDRGPGSERFEAVARVSALGLRPGWPSPASLVRLCRHMAESRPHLAVTWLYHADLLGGLAARAQGIPVCWNVRHGAVDRRTTRPATRWVAKLCAALSRRLPAAIVFNSVGSLTAHAELGYDRAAARVIPNGVDLARFRPDAEARASLRRELSLPSEAPLIGIAGRFCPDKDFQTFCDCAAAVARARPDAWFLACGAGVDAGNAPLTGWLRERGLASRTRLLGVRRDMPRVLAALDLLVCSSRTEAFPNVVTEALACGVRCASTDVGDVRELLGGAGRVAPVGDAAALAEACLAGLARRADAEQARAQAARFSLGPMVERHANLWESLGASRHSLPRGPTTSRASAGSPSAAPTIAGGAGARRRFGCAAAADTTCRGGR